MEDARKSILTFAVIVFTLLGILFGMNIMTFIFGNLGVSQQGIFTDTTIPVINETGAHINQTTYTVAGASVNGFLGGVAVTQALNASDSSVINAGNFTVNVTTGVIVNASPINYNSATFSYTYLRKSTPEIISEAVNNNSLGSINTYSAQSNTQMSTVAIAITLIILLAVFAFFWAFFVGAQGKKKGKGAGNFT